MWKCKTKGTLRNDAGSWHVLSSRCTVLLLLLLLLLALLLAAVAQRHRCVTRAGALAEFIKPITVLLEVQR